MGHEVIDRDREVHAALLKEFGAGVATPDGMIDRAALGRLVFSDPGRRERLNALTHPAILKRTAEWVTAQRKHGHDCVAAIIPLLYEVGAEKEWDKVICVAAPEADQARRLAERGLSPDESRARVCAQLGLSVKMERSDYVIYNCGSMELLEEQVNLVWRNIRGV